MVMTGGWLILVDDIVIPTLTAVFHSANCYQLVQDPIHWHALPRQFFATAGNVHGIKATRITFGLLLLARISSIC